MMHQPAARARNKVHPQSREHRMKYREHRHQHRYHTTSKTLCVKSDTAPLPCDGQAMKPLATGGWQHKMVHQPERREHETKCAPPEPKAPNTLHVHANHLVRQIVGVFGSKMCTPAGTEKHHDHKMGGPQITNKTTPKSLKKVLFLKPA